MKLMVQRRPSARWLVLLVGLAALAVTTAALVPHDDGNLDEQHCLVCKAGHQPLTELTVELISGTDAPRELQCGTSAPKPASLTWMTASLMIAPAPDPEPALIGDTVFCDLNDNGTQEDGEPGIPDVVVHLVCAGPDGADEVHTLLVWMNGQGSRRIDQYDRESATRLVLELLAEARPASRGQLEVMGYHSWGQTPFIGGCGHSYSAGQVARYAAGLPAPEGRLHFAGEHTRRREFGMEAAMASAERVVTEILDTA